MKKLGLLIILILSVLSAVDYSKEEVPKECKQKRYCSQMTSCEEAKYYLELCGDYARMDGDKDGIPCERQWCN